jgi:LPPG:FO 2-phospho-L-lactate transferase
MAELGIQVTAIAVAERYTDLIDGYVLDHADTASTAALGIPVTVAQTLMLTLDDREALARHVLAAADALAKAAA